MMPTKSTIPELCRRGIQRLGVVGLLFLASLLGFIVLYWTGWSGLSLVIDTIVLCVTGIWVFVRLVRYVSRHSLWSLRSRLLTVYALIGILPIALILVLVGLGLWSLTSELAIYLASSALDRRLSTVRSAAEYLDHTPPEKRKTAAPELLKAFNVHFPGLCFYTDDATGKHSYPEGTPDLNLLPGWKDVTGLIERDGKFYGWAHIVRGDETVTAMAPVTDDFIGDLVPNLGQITLTDTFHHGAVGKNPDVEYTHHQWRLKNPKTDSVPQIAIHNAGHIPPPVNRFDIDLNWIAMYPHYDWAEPNKKYSAVLLVRSRPSAVFSVIFTTADLARSALVGIIIGVAVLFLLVEIVALIIGLSLSKRITKAVNELYEGTRRVIYGDFRHRIPVRGSDQVAELTTSFNQMTGNLERLLSVEKEKERLQAELEIAREVQTQLYPRAAPPSRGLRLTVHCEPARMVSGDYYDYETVTTQKIAFAIGDVAGKGISAALLMATVQAALRAQISAALPIGGDADCHIESARLVSELNKQLYAHTAPEKYATFFFAMYDDHSGTLTYTNAGHLPPILIRNEKAVTLDTNGTVVGAFPFAQYDESRIRFEAGDLLVCYTDGITEPENAYGEMFGEERLIDLVKRSAHEDDNVIIKKVTDAVRNWHSAEELPDDMTLLIARRLEQA
ncbi:MAG TPA: PP2C family protein-serine/threonine phosphatase [Bryobacteraceae bacterium]|nr:PP2C family protein-serine/threonine phosphatase [Bryobacteraceae bacterium]